MNLNLYDSDLNRIAIIGNNYVSCLWSEGYNTVENFTLELRETEEYKKKIRADCYVGRSDRKTLMVIKTVEFANHTIIASGKQATRVLDDVAFVGAIESGAMVDTSIKNAYNNSSKYPNVEFVETGLQIPYPEQIENKSILSLCETMAQKTDMGFRAKKDNRTILIEFYKPTQNPNLIFSEKFGNLFLESVTMSTENLKNCAIVIGAEQKNVVVDLSSSQKKLELIVDESGTQKEESETDQSYENRLRAIGTEKLLEQQETFNCAFAPHSDDFGKKYDLGDILTIYLTDFEIKLQARVSRFTQKSQNNKTTTTIQVGKITVKR